MEKKYGGTWKIYESATVYHGELHINEEKRIVALELLIPAEEDNPMPAPPYKGRIPYICGTLFSGARVMLYNCETEGEHRHFGQFTRQVIYADYAFWGLSVSTQDEIVFHKVYLDYGNILAWARLCDYDWDFLDSGGVNLVWKRKKPVSLQLNEELVVTLFPTQGSISTDRYAREISARQLIMTELCYNEPVRWEKILEDTRNYYTHYSLDKLGKTFSKEELPLVNSQLLALLEYHLQILLGFNPDDVRKKTVEKINQVQVAHSISANTHRVERG